MKYGLDVATTGDYSSPRLLVDLAVKAEGAGWDGFFLWDALLSDKPDEPVADPWTVLAAVAVRTRRIRLGAFMTPLARRRPWVVARQAATLDQLSGGRLIFGAALGFHKPDFEAFGEEADPKIRAWTRHCE